MEVNINNTSNTMPFPAFKTPERLETRGAEVKLSEQIIQPKFDMHIAEKSMMDLQDVQNFLYLIVKTRIHVDAGTRAVGVNLDAQV
ncbi:MAG: hypothetical protein MUD12_06780 [Spirochaetes bacterium]|jgi:hypothetical protein|nr:hypothetical protein [Spirochaetota bacterium]